MEDTKKFAEEMRKVDWTNPMERRAVAQIIVRQLKDEQANQDIVSRIADQVSFGEGDTIQFVTRKGGKAYVHSPGSAAPRSTITNRVQTLEAENVSVNMEFELDQLRTGRYGNMNEVRKWARQALLHRKYKTVWDVLRGSIATSDSNYSAIARSSNPATLKYSLDQAIDHVEDQVGGENTAILARRNDLSWLLRWGEGSSVIDYSDTMKDKINKTGAVGQYRGVPIFLMNKWVDSYNVDVIASGDIMVVNSSTAKVGVVRGIEALDSLDINSRMWNVAVSERYGVGVFFPERNYKLTFTG